MASSFGELGLLPISDVAFKAVANGAAASLQVTVTQPAALVSLDRYPADIAHGLQVVQQTVSQVPHPVCLSLVTPLCSLQL